MNESLQIILYKMARENYLYPKVGVDDLIAMGLGFHDVGYCIQNNLSAELIQAALSYQELIPFNEQEASE